MKRSFNNLPLFWRVLLSTSFVLTGLFALTGWAVQTYAVRVSEKNLEREVRTGLETSEALWSMRARSLFSISRVISSMSDVRAAFMTGDEATIRDSAQELWSRVSEDDAIFVVLDPRGAVLSSLGGDFADPVVSRLSLKGALKQFPRQVSGFLTRGHRLFYVVLTPVYVQSGSDQALINVLLAGFEVNAKFARTLKQMTRGGDFAFLASNRIIASTLGTSPLSQIDFERQSPDSFRKLQIGSQDYLVLGSRLKDIEGAPIGELLVLHSFADARFALDSLQRNVALIWVCAIFVGLAFTSLMARRIVGPVKQLDIAASEIARHNYAYRVPIANSDELGRLARTFNEMCDSISTARQELIRQERLATIARLSSSIVHDLRNPLSAIYGAAEMLIDGNLTPDQSTRLNVSIYKASRRIQELLEDLVNVSRGKGERLEMCRVRDVILSAQDALGGLPETNKVALAIAVPDDMQLLLDRARMVRVFVNMMTNACEAMPHGGELRITGRSESDSVVIEIDDNGGGISPEVRDNLFQPFVSGGKKNGLGLGLALSRQTVLDHGGDLRSCQKGTPGARFEIQLPLKPSDPRITVSGKTAAAG